MADTTDDGSVSPAPVDEVTDATPASEPEVSAPAEGAALAAPQEDEGTPSEEPASDGAATPVAEVAAGGDEPAPTDVTTGDAADGTATGTGEAGVVESDVATAAPADAPVEGEAGSGGDGDDVATATESGVGDVGETAGDASATAASEEGDANTGAAEAEGEAEAGAEAEAEAEAGAEAAAAPPANACEGTDHDGTAPSADDEGGDDAKAEEEAAEPVEEVIKTEFSNTNLRRTEWMFVDSPAGAATYVWRNETKKTCRVVLHASVEATEREQEFSMTDIKPRYALKQDEKLTVAWANLALAVKDKKKKDWALASMHYGRGIDYLNGVNESEVSAEEWAKAQTSLVSSFVELAICSEKLADQRDSQPARKQASSRPTPGQKPLSATNLRKKALSFCDESLSRNEGAKDPVMFVRAYYCIAKLRLSQQEFEKAITAAKAGQQVPADVLAGLDGKKAKKVDKFVTGLKTIQVRAAKMKKQYQRKAGGFLLTSDGLASSTPPAPAVATPDSTSTTGTGAAVSAASASASPDKSVSRSPSRSALRTSTSSSKKSSKNAHVAFDATVAGGESDSEDVETDSEESSSWGLGRLFAGTVAAVGLIALTAFMLAKNGSSQRRLRRLRR